jgi:uncharacterized membrane protein
MLNWIGVVGICYLVMWNFLGVVASIVMRKKDNMSKWLPIFLVATTVVTFLFGYFGRD